MKRWFTISVLLLATLSGDFLLAQPVDGENQFRLSAINSRRDGLDSNAGRGIIATRDDADLDGDGLPEILITNYFMIN